MRFAALVAAIVLGAAIAACGGDDEAAPLTLEQRIVGEVEARGSAPDPVLGRHTANDLAELARIMEDRLITATEEDAARVEKDGFVSAFVDGRFFPTEPGGAHPPPGEERLPHVVSLVAQFASEAGAADAAKLLYEDGLEPCPETCAFDITKFEVDGIPDATGVRRFATQEALDRVGDTERVPEDKYTIRFADGVFAYEIELFGPPGEVSEQQAEEIAKKLYERVQGAPLPESG